MDKLLSLRERVPPDKSHLVSTEQANVGANRPDVKMQKVMITFVFITGLLARLLLAYFSPGASYDMASFRMQGQAVLDGQNIYAATAGRHPYPPVWMFVPTTALILEERTGWPFAFWVRLPAIGFDLGIGALLWVLSRRRKDPPAALRDTMIYVFNPIALLVVSHGMFDAIPLFFILLAYLSIATLSTKRRAILSALSLGLGIAIKGFPVLALPAFVLKQKKWQHRVAFGLVSLLPLAVLMPFILAGGRTAAGRIFARVGVSDHGYGLLLQTLANAGHPVLQRGLDLLRNSGSVLVLGSAALGAWIARRKQLGELIVLSFGLTFVVSVGIASQYLLWVLPFLILVDSRRAIVYSGLSTVTLLIYYAIWGPGVIGLRTAVDLEMLNPIRLVAEALWWLACLELVWAVIRGKTDAPVVISRRLLPRLVFLSLVTSLFVIGSLSWWRIKFPEVAQRQADQPVGELLSSSTVGQSFYSPADGLYQIDLMFGTYGHPGTSDVILHLKRSPDATEDLVTARINSQNIENDAFNSFRFPQQRGIAERMLYFYLEAPGASPGNAITLYRSNGEGYRDGQAYYNDVAASNDLTFVARYRLDPLEAVRFVLRQLSDRRPCLLGNPLFYVMLVVVYLSLVGRLFVFLQEHKAQARGGEEKT